MSERPTPLNPEDEPSLRLNDREAELWVEEVQNDRSIILNPTEREAGLRRSGQVALNTTEREIGLKTVEAEISVVQVESERADIALRKLMAYWLLSIFTVNTASALLIVFLAGLGRIILSEKIIISVLAATVAEAATMLFTVAKYLFPARTSSDT